MSSPAIVRLAVAALALTACQNERKSTSIAPSPPRAICQAPHVADDDVCVPPTALLDRLAREPIEILEAVVAPGTTPALKAIVRLTEAPSLVVPIKWRATPAGAGDAFNNSPRRELAAVAAATLLFGADNDLVPPSTLRCLEPKTHDKITQDAEPTFEDSTCVLGVITVWLPNVEEVEELWDPARFEADAAYRRAVSRLNVFARIIDHRDSHARNVVVDDEDEPTRVFLIDNSLAFSGLFNPLVRWLGVDRDWASPIIPAIPTEVRRDLARFDPAALDRLATVVELEHTPGGGWQLVRSVGAQGAQAQPFDAKRGVRRRDGTVQLGLTDEEIRAMKHRFLAILEE